MTCRLAVVLLAFAGAVNATPPQCARPAERGALAPLRQALAAGRFVAYEPTSLQVSDGRVRDADPASIRADLALLRRSFDSLITYDVIHGAEHIAASAAALKFRALILGVWNPQNEAELRAAGAALRAYPHLIVGVVLGNELLFSRRSDAAALGAALRHARQLLPQVPLATTEPFHVYYQESLAPLLAEFDFLTANVHPVFQPWFRDAPAANAAQFVVNVVAELGQHYCGPILVKETGEPSAPAQLGFSEARQADFYRQLRRLFVPAPGRAFAYFAAFDAPWRGADATGVPGPPGPHPEEAHWGLYDAARQPKLAARELPPLTSPPFPP